MGKDLKTRKTEALKEARVTYAEDIAFYKMLQYLFFKQWWDLKAYVNDLGIEIIGDVPIYVAETVLMSGQIRDSFISMRS